MSSGKRPRDGYVYVFWHDKGPSLHTKIGYSRRHPCVPEEGFKATRHSHLGFSLEAFGFGGLKCWSTSYLDDARSVEEAAHLALSDKRRKDVGTAKEIFAVPSDEAIEILKGLVRAETY
ncbi:GIY-YIG nuclease family protein [uncultured Sphingomonas sp.]|uniref:GIY-YIG nuclease family protein n=1 Tax=uncultured Sphingomonas sp. TaxID=158754 RepID=UPI0025FD6002|nr:GIY-YIG nuclease family protein [uncultured Sphingomonas sp.]